MSLLMTNIKGKRDFGLKDDGFIGHLLK